MMMIILGYLGVGIGAGILAGLFGVGGGLIIVPVLVFLFQAQGINSQIIVHLAIGTSLATIIMTSLSSVYAHHQRQAVLWHLVSQLTPGIVLGTWLGAKIVNFLPTHTLKTIFGVFELLIAIKVGFDLHANPARQLPKQSVLILIGAIIGFISGIIGIGGGVLTVPFLTWCNIPLRNAIATSAACGLPISVAGSLGFIVTGWGMSLLPPYSIGYIYLPALFGVAAASVITAPFGARLAHTLPTKLLKKLLMLLLIMLGIRMLLITQ